MASPEPWRGAALGCAAALLSAALLWHATGLSPSWWLAWIAVAPVLAFAVRASAPAAALAAFAAWAGGGLNLWHYYRSTLGVPLGVVLLATAVPALAFCGCSLLVRALARRDRPRLALLALPSAWTAYEHVLARLSPHGSFGSLAYTQLDLLPVVQLAAICGTAGISFLVLLVPSALALATLPSSRTARGRNGLFVAALVALALGHGAWRLRQDEPSRTRLQVGLAAADRPEQPVGMSAEHGRQTELGRELMARYALAVGTLAAAGADVIVLPETVLQAPVAAADAEAARLAGPRGARAPTLVVGIDRQGPTEQNAALALLPDGTRSLYAKQHLLQPPERRYTAGHELTRVPVRSVPAGLAICKDLDFPQLGRAYSRAGAALLLVPAWDFVDDGWLHARMAVLRGVEGGFAVARAARSGRLTLSDDRGRLLADAGSGGAAISVVLASVSVGSPGTVYAAFGDWFGWLCCGLLVAALVVVFAPPARA